MARIARMEVAPDGQPAAEGRPFVPGLAFQPRSLILSWKMISAEAMEVFHRIPMIIWVTGGATAFVAFLAGLAFSRGVVKQLIGMVCLAAGVCVAWFCFRHRVQVFGPSAVSMGTDRLLIFSAIVGGIGYGVARVVIHLLGAIGLISLAGLAGWRGMMLSILPSGFLLWVSAMALRLIGDLYGLETASAVARETTRIESSFGQVAESLRKTLDHTMFGGLIANVDPFSIRPTANLARLLIVWPQQRVWQRMIQHPKIARVYGNAEILELGLNPRVRHCIDAKDFAGLMQLPEVERVAARPDLKALLSDVELEDAMDAILYGRVPNRRG